jgi:hypothetical protein
MMHFLEGPVLHLLLASLLLSGCGGDAPQNPAEADHTYGAAVDPTDAIPVPVVAAEAARHGGQRVTVDGRIAGVARDGCTLHLATDTGPPLRVDAARTGTDTCAWQVPAGTDGFAVAAGTLRTAADTLRLTANGVQVTPLRSSGGNPAP